MPKRLTLLIASFFLCSTAHADKQSPVLTPDSPVQPESFTYGDRNTSSVDDLSATPSTIVSGFWDSRVGTRLQDDAFEDQTSLAETRLRLNLELPRDKATFTLKTDFVYDDAEDDPSIDLETGDGWLDLREASLQFKPLPNLDIKAGRQTLAWDKSRSILSINDRFPKDYRSFALGRDTKYLKVPSDAVKLTIGSPSARLDLVYTPRFDANRFVDGSRLSFFNNRLGRISGQDAIVQVDQPNDWFNDDETALRLSRRINGYEAALYAYRGYWKSPEGFDRRTGKATFPRLSVYGASIRGAIGQYGGGKLEFGYFDSMDDRNGNNPLIRNSETRFIAAYRQALAKNMILGAKYYLEHKLDYDALKRVTPANRTIADQNRHVLTLRLEHLRMQKNLKLILLGFYSPSDEDGYLRPSLSYKVNKDWHVEGGVNWFFGESEQTFFGQLEDNSNIYFGVRYNFSPQD